MIERKIIGDKLKTFVISNFLKEQMRGVPVDKIELENSPVGERITIYTSVPGLVIGREGSNIKKLTQVLKDEFKFENPQIKIGEVKNASLSAAIMAKTIANNLSNFGSQKFKLTGFKAMTAIMDAGALGCEIKLSGKLPSSRAKSWRFAKGYIKKTGFISDYVIDHAIDHVTLKTGVVGIKVSIMLPDTPLPDKVIYHEIATTTPKEKEEKIINEKKEEVIKEEKPSSRKAPAEKKEVKEVVEE
ncbi:MAG: 30S ribosomal protein S3 [Nanoarchaeota archaeon]